MKNEKLLRVNALGNEHKASEALGENLSFRFCDTFRYL